MRCLFLENSLVLSLSLDQLSYPFPPFITHLSLELTDLSQFREMRITLLKNLAAAKKSMLKNQLRHEEQLKKLEDKFSVARGELQKQVSVVCAYFVGFFGVPFLV